MSAENKELVKTFMQHLTNGEIDDACECLADDLEWRIVATSRPASLTKAQLKEALRTMTSVFVDGNFRMSPLEMMAEGNKVAVEAESFGKTKAGEIYNNKYHYRFIVQNGKLIEVREYADTAHVMAVLSPLLARARSG